MHGFPQVTDSKPLAGLRQIKLRGNASVELWLLVAWVVFLLFVVVPWMIRQGD